MPGILLIIPLLQMLGIAKKHAAEQQKQEEERLKLLNEKKKTEAALMAKVRKYSMQKITHKFEALYRSSQNFMYHLLCAHVWRACIHYMVSCRKK